MAFRVGLLTQRHGGAEGTEIGRKELRGRIRSVDLAVYYLTQSRKGAEAQRGMRNSDDWVYFWIDKLNADRSAQTE